MRYLFQIIATLAVGCTPGDKTHAVNGDDATAVADIVYTSGKVFTVNNAAPWAEAVAIKDGKFLAVGSNDDIAAVTGDTTDVFDLRGNLVTPGLVDPHTHAFEDYHSNNFAFSIQDKSSPESILAEVKAYAAANPDKEWITGGNWPVPMFPGDNPHRDLLDQVISDRPVCLTDMSAHSFWCNTKALEVTGIMNPDNEIPPGAVIERDADGTPSGTVREHAIGLVRRTIPAVPHEEWVATGRGFMQWFSSLGVTSTQIAAGNHAHLSAARELEDQGELSVRLVFALNYNYFDSPETKEQEGEFAFQAHEFKTEFIDPSHIKIFMDGTPNAYAAWMLEKYPGTDSYGTGYYQPHELVALYKKFTGKGLGVMSHAIGDRSVREVLNAIEAVKEAYPDTNVRHHITHTAMVHDDDVPRFAELGVAFEVAPVLVASKPLQELMLPIIGEKYLNDYANPRRAIDSGAVVGTGSDWQVAFMDPWKRIEYMVTRMDPDDREAAQMMPPNAISVGEAITIYTLGPAYAINKDKEIGSIEVGKYADMIVLDRDLFEIDPLEIAGTKVLTTVFAGKVVYQAD